MSRSILVVGTGPMASEYARVLRARERPFLVVARDPARTAAFAQEHGAEGHALLDALDAAVVEGREAIVCTTPESLCDVASSLVDRGAKRLLVEKPGALSAAGLRALASRAEKAGVEVRVATNRRFYGSVLALSRRLADDGAVAATFDFTEWPDRVAASGRAPETLERWALANSVHVIDTVVALLGPLSPDVVHVADEGAIPWHPAGATFLGCGRCVDVPVSWASSWIAPGRWSVEIRTRTASYRLAPMEQLQVRRPSSVAWETVPSEDDLDSDFKPGLFRTVEAFESKHDRLPTADRFAEVLAVTERLAGYTS